MEEFHSKYDEMVTQLNAFSDFAKQLADLGEMMKETSALLGKLRHQAETPATDITTADSVAIPVNVAASDYSPTTVLEAVEVDEKVVPSTGGEVLKAGISAFDCNSLVQGALLASLPPRRAPLHPSRPRQSRRAPLRRFPLSRRWRAPPLRRPRRAPPRPPRLRRPRRAPPRRRGRPPRLLIRGRSPQLRARARPCARPPQGALRVRLRRLRAQEDERDYEPAIYDSASPSPMAEPLVIAASSSIELATHPEPLLYDRLSLLPDVLLRDIVSRLPLKDAARTAVLSRRWRPLWCATPLVGVLQANQRAGIMMDPENAEVRLGVTFGQEELLPRRPDGRTVSCGLPQVLPTRCSTLVHIHIQCAPASVTATPAPIPPRRRPWRVPPRPPWLRRPRLDPPHPPWLRRPRSATCFGSGKYALHATLLGGYDGSLDDDPGSGFAHLDAPLDRAVRRVVRAIAAVTALRTDAVGAAAGVLLAWVVAAGRAVGTDVLLVSLPTAALTTPSTTTVLAIAPAPLNKVTTLVPPAVEFQDIPEHDEPKLVTVVTIASKPTPTLLNAQVEFDELQPRYITTLQPFHFIEILLLACATNFHEGRKQFEEMVEPLDQVVWSVPTSELSSSMTYMMRFLCYEIDYGIVGSGFQQAQLTVGFLLEASPWLVLKLSIAVPKLQHIQSQFWSSWLLTCPRSICISCIFRLVGGLASFFSQWAKCWSWKQIIFSCNYSVKIVASVIGRQQYILMVYFLIIPWLASGKARLVERLTGAKFELTPVLYWTLSVVFVPDIDVTAQLLGVFVVQEQFCWYSNIPSMSVLGAACFFLVIASKHCASAIYPSAQFGGLKMFTKQLHRSIQLHALSECELIGLCINSFLYKDDLFPGFDGKCSVAVRGHALLPQPKPPDQSVWDVANLELLLGFAHWAPSGSILQFLWSDMLHIFWKFSDQHPWLSMQQNSVKWFAMLPHSYQYKYKLLADVNSRTHGRWSNIIFTLQFYNLVIEDP